MNIRKYGLLLLACIFVANYGMGAIASERCDLMLVNALGEEIISFRIQYSTPYGEPRNSSSVIFLKPGGDYRLGVQGTTLPERILVDLATKTYDFADLSGIGPENNMQLEIGHKDGRPVLIRTDAGGQSVTGEERDFLTTGNRPNALNFTDLSGAKSLDDVQKMIAMLVEEHQERQGVAESVDVEAGPLWNNDHASERCPEVVAKWNDDNFKEARWTGGWATTVPGEMSVCSCVVGVAGLGETLFEENIGWGKMLYFPVVWEDWFGVARVQEINKNAVEEGIGLDLRFRIPKEGSSNIILGALGDLYQDDYRPLRFKITSWDNEKGERNENELSFKDDEDHNQVDTKKMWDMLSSTYADASLVQAGLLWVKKETFQKLKSGEEPPKESGVMVIFTLGTLQAVVIPDARMLIR